MQQVWEELLLLLHLIKYLKFVVNEILVFLNEVFCNFPINVSLILTDFDAIVSPERMLAIFGATYSHYGWKFHGEAQE